MKSKEALEKITSYVFIIGETTPYSCLGGIFPEEVEEIKKDLEVLEILKDKEVDVNFFKTLIPFHKEEEDLMINYNATRWKGKLTLEETIKIKEWLKNE